MRARRALARLAPAFFVLTLAAAPSCAGGDDGALTVNEVNTMPGFTSTSMFPQMWAASGLDYPALVDVLVQSALRRRPGLLR